MPRSYIILGGLAAIVFLALSSLYIVDERKQAIVLQFGQVKDVKQEPGLGFKIPFIQNVVYYEDRILPLDTEEKRLLARALKATKGNVRRAAQLLRIGRATLYRKIQIYDLRLN